MPFFLVLLFGLIYGESKTNKLFVISLSMIQFGDKAQAVSMPQSKFFQGGMADSDKPHDPAAKADRAKELADLYPDIQKQ